MTDDDIESLLEAIRNDEAKIVHGGMKNHRGWTLGRRIDNELNGVNG